MARSFPQGTAACQEQGPSLAGAARGNSLSLLRQAVDKSDWTHEALAVAMRAAGANVPNAAYLSRMLSGEKPWTLRHLEALPDDIEAIYYGLRYEALGGIAAEPAASPREAMRHLTSGLAGLAALLESRLPDRAGPPLKVGLLDGKAVSR